MKIGHTIRLEKFWLRSVVALAIISSQLATSVEAAGKLVSVGAVLQVEGSDGSVIACAEIDGRWEPGVLVSPVLMLFNPTKSSYDQRRRRLKRSLGTARETKSRRAFRKVSRQLKRGRETCLSARGGGDGGNPTPTPPPVNPNPNYDDQGNVTAAGKLRFMIPQNLPANISVGRTFFLQNCNDCHGDKVDKTFTFVRDRIAQAPMFFTPEEVPDADLANVIAYLNRFQP